jgi:hypothetical protein
MKVKKPTFSINDDCGIYFSFLLVCIEGVIKIAENRKRRNIPKTSPLVTLYHCIGKKTFCNEIFFFIVRTDVDD